MLFVALVAVAVAIYLGYSRHEAQQALLLQDRENRKAAARARAAHVKASLNAYASEKPIGYIARTPMDAPRTRKSAEELRIIRQADERLAILTAERAKASSKH